MEASPTDHERIKDYLLGRIPEEEDAEVGARLLTDHQFYEELSIVEDELIDRYLGGTLSDSDRESFESHFVSSYERQQKVRFARALRKRVSVTQTARLVSPPRSSFFPFRISYAVAAATVLIIVGGSLLLLYRRSLSPSGRVLAIELTPAPATRDVSEVKQFGLTPDIGSVHLQLDLADNEYQSYEAVLRDSSLRSMHTVKNLKPQIVNNFAAVIVDLNADLLSPGDYRIQLSGTTPDGRSENVATYSFTVRTR